jgi:NAD(P)-dependent dehydrogenase (short-subunit alcohol dehydrogenase family)
MTSTRKSRAGRPLDGRIAVVAGATRGAGRGIARALGEAGATVYCTGRSVPGAPSPYGRPETIDETAAMIQEAGGTAIAVRVDHSIEAEVAALVGRVARDHGRLDVLADSVGGEDPQLGPWSAMVESDLSHAHAAIGNSLVSHLLTAKHAALLMKKNAKPRGGLLVQVSEHDLLFSGGGNLIASIVKSSLKGLAVLLAAELRKARITSVSISPGFLRSETMLQHFGVTEETWREGAKKDPNFIHSETPLFVGRAVAALAADPKAIERSGDMLNSWDLAREYGFTDANGERPDWGTHWRTTVVPSMPWLRNGLTEHLRWLERTTANVKSQLSGVEGAVVSG